MKLAHVWFGSILGEDGKPFKTRSGETVKLADLLDEAEERAFKVVSEKNPDLPEAQRREIARVVGLGGHQICGFVAEPAKRLRFQLGQNAGAEWQHRALFAVCLHAHPKHLSQRRDGSGAGAGTSDPLTLNAPDETTLARHLLNFGLVLEAVTEEYRPNFLCNYLYELAGTSHGFTKIVQCSKPKPLERASRLVLCDLTAKVLRQGLEILGIETLEQM